jgi:D-glycero-alpha-D-manno-heptose 1-phosphate guanylyltransferase
MAVGYKHHIIQEYLKQNAKFSDLQIRYSVETELLGTGGAILQAMDQVEGDSAFIVNGDTFFDISLSKLEAFGQSNSSEIAIALKELPYSDRYGLISCSESGRILSFSSDGVNNANSILINGGIYYLQKQVLQKFSLPNKFSIEKDFFQPYIEEIKAYGKVFDSTFIDIGIPDDYALAQRLLKDVFPN